MISQKQKLQQQQKFLPQQIMLMRLLQTPAIALEQTIKDEIEKNPMLEEAEHFENGDTTFEEKNENSDNDDDSAYDINDFVEDDDIADYKLKSDNYDKNSENKPFNQTAENSFQEYLVEQLGWQKLSETEYLIGLEIIGNLDDAGYLSRSAKALVNDIILRHNLFVAEEDILNVLSIIQSFDPSGIGARNLQECLLIQLKRKTKTPSTELATQIIDKCFEAFTKKHYDKICQKFGIDEQELKSALDEIIKLDPKPSGNIATRSLKDNNYITPDFYLFNNNGKIEFHLNNSFVPNLQVNKYYTNLLQGISENKAKNKDDKQAILFIKDCIDSAKWFIEAINQRQNTLEKTLSAIVHHQYDYFLNGDINKLRPMKLKDIADVTGYDISTVSRVVNQKYVQTHFGTFLLKDFFSSSFTDNEGNDVATDTIKKILIECIENENKQKPMTDEELKEILNKKGYPVARRTVAKYRESLKIPVGRLRKKIQE